MRRKIVLPPEPAPAARALARQAHSAVLSTADNATTRPRRGWPAASLVTIACDTDGSPLLLLSDIAHHTQNIRRDPRASILVDGTVGFDNPQQGPRATFMGRVAPTRSPRHADRFLARHPDARGYAMFTDFNFYRMKIDRVHFVGGFARAHWVPGGKVTSNRRAADEIRRIEADVLLHMNNDHAEAVALFGQRLVGARGKHWKMIGIDPDGIDLRCGGSLHRLDFDRPIADAQESRTRLVELTKMARAT